MGTVPWSSADQVQQIVMDSLIAGANGPFGQHLGAAVRVGPAASRLVHDDNSSGDIPGLQITLPEAVVISRGNKAKIEGGGAETAKIADLRHDRGEIGREARMFLGLAEMRNAAADQCPGYVAPRGHAQ